MCIDGRVVIADEIATALEARVELRIVACDLKGALDQVWLHGLLAHLWAVGIRGKGFKLLCTCLSERFFVVVTNGNKFELCQIQSVVSQGGIWSPLLFHLLAVQHAMMLCFADDTTILMSVQVEGRHVLPCLTLTWRGL